MNTKSILICSFVLLACLSGLARAGTIDIPLVTVGDPGNVADPATGLGAVPYTYQIGEFDVTIADYTAFLNAVTVSSTEPYHPIDQYGLYDSLMARYGASFGITPGGGGGGFTFRGNGDIPVTFVTWADAARFVNWLANGQSARLEGPGTTETGTYNLNGAMTQAALAAVTRSSSATWVLPNVDEWYKVAYYVGGGTNAGYWTFPTRSNDIPSNVLSATGTNNANFWDSTNSGAPNYGFCNPGIELTPVGAFAASPGAYGTYDQGGDVFQWNETPTDGLYRDIRGGAWDGDWVSLDKSDTYDYTDPTLASQDIGFRVAYVPEPNDVPLLVAAVTIFFFLQMFPSYLKRVRRTRTRCKELDSSITSTPATGLR